MTELNLETVVLNGVRVACGQRDQPRMASRRPVRGASAVALSSKRHLPTTSNPNRQMSRGMTRHTAIVPRIEPVGSLTSLVPRHVAGPLLREGPRRPHVTDYALAHAAVCSVYVTASRRRGRPIPVLQLHQGVQRQASWRVSRHA